MHLALAFLASYYLHPKKKCMGKGAQTTLLNVPEDPQPPAFDTGRATCKARDLPGEGSRSVLPTYPPTYPSTYNRGSSVAPQY